MPYDAYELSAWPSTRNGRRDALVRYQFQTRNMETAPLVRVLARAVLDVTFMLVQTFCLDDSSIEKGLIEAGRQRKDTAAANVSSALGTCPPGSSASLATMCTRTTTRNDGRKRCSKTP